MARRRLPGGAAAQFWWVVGFMVVLVIAFPATVTALLDKPLDVDLSKIKIEVPQIEMPPLDFGPPKQQ